MHLAHLARGLTLLACGRRLPVCLFIIIIIIHFLLVLLLIEVLFHHLPVHFIIIIHFLLVLLLIEVFYHQLLQRLGRSAVGVACPAQEIIPISTKLLVDGETKSNAV